MVETKKLLLVFIPAIIIAGAGLFIRIVQYEPLFPKQNEDEPTQDIVTIPIYPEDPILGDKKAPITIVAFEDFACPSCREQSYIFDQLLEEYPGQFKIIWKGLAVSSFPYPAQNAHNYAYCADQQNKFSEFKQYAFNNSDNLSETILQNIAQNIELKDNKLSSCLASGEPTAYREKNELIAEIMNVQSVPTFFIDNIQIDHPTTLSGWKSYLNLE